MGKPKDTETENLNTYGEHGAENASVEVEKDNGENTEGEVTGTVKNGMTVNPVNSRNTGTGNGYEGGTTTGTAKTSK